METEETLKSKIIDLRAVINNNSFRQTNLLRLYPPDGGGRGREASSKIRMASAEIQTIQKRIEELQEEKQQNELNRDKLERIFLSKNEDGKIGVSIEQKNGVFVYSNGITKLESNIFIYSSTKWLNVIKELEDMINDQNVKEQDLQDYLERYPEFILEDNFEEPIPQATIISDKGHKWRADFILRPFDQSKFCKILELKLPKAPYLNKPRSGHQKYSARLMEAINQLKDYGQAFNNSNTRELFFNKYETDIFKPHLHLIIGRKPAKGKFESILELQDREKIEISNWDSFIEKLKRKWI